MIEKTQELVRNWLMSNENIYESTILSYPSISSQQYILHYTTLSNFTKIYTNLHDLQKNIKFDNSKDFHKGVIYMMFQNPTSQKYLYDIIKTNGLHDLLLFYTELTEFLLTQFYQLKESHKGSVYQIMEMLIENPLEQFDECFKVFLRNVQIHNKDPKQFLEFSFRNFERIFIKNQLAGLLFLKYLLILQLDEVHTIHFPVDIIVRYMHCIWEKHQKYLLTFGRELLLNLQLECLSKFNIPVDELMNNTFITKVSYKTNYQMGISPELEVRLKFAIFQQMRSESLKIHLTLLFENHGYHIQLIGQIVRYLTCMVEFEDSSDAIQYRIGETFLIIHQICEFDAERWPVYLKFIFSDLFTYNAKDDHNIQPGIYFIKILQIHKMYPELNSVLWFIFQTFEQNDSLKRKVFQYLGNLGRFLVFQKLINDTQIQERIQRKIEEYFLVVQTQNEDGLHYSEENSSRPYSVDMVLEYEQPFNLDTEQIPQSPQQMDSPYFSNNNNNNNNDEGPFMDINKQFYQILQREKLDLIFQQPNDKSLLLKLLNVFTKPINQDIKPLVLEEISKLCLILYEDQFFDINFEYEFNIIVEIRQLGSNFMEEVLQQLILYEPFTLVLLALGYCEGRIYKLYPHNLNESVAKLEKLLSSERFDKLLQKLIEWRWHFEDYALRCKILSKIQFKTLQESHIMFSEPQIKEMYPFICILEEVNKQNYIHKLLIQQITQYSEQKILEMLITLINKRIGEFWNLYKSLLLEIMRKQLLSEDSLITFFCECFKYSSQDPNGINQLFHYVPNTSKSIIFKGLQQYQMKLNNINIVHALLIEPLSPFQQQIKNFITKQ